MLKVFRKKVSGEKRGEKIGFPTLNFPLKKGDKIKRGVWLVRLKIGKKEYFGLANAGKPKTFTPLKKVPERIEVHLFSKPARDIKKAEIYFLKYLRKTKKFKKIENLKKQIKRDIKKAKSLLNFL